MAITAASIEANGWVLQVTHTAGLGSFASYALDPNGVPRLVMTAASNGFTPSAGQAVAATPTRTFVGTKPLRLPVSATNAGVRAAKTIDETDLGGGIVRVRIALSQHVYASDAGLSLAVVAGWRAGESGQTIVVTNTSSVTAPQPIARWSDVPYQLVEGSFDLEVVAVSHHPNELAPVAGVRFTVTDGTSAQTYWTTALSTSTRFGDALRVYKVTVDPTTATALSKGLLRCDYAVFPWIGAARVSDVPGTRSMAGLGTAALATSAQVPFVVAYNPGATWITPRYAYVVADGSGAATAAANRVGTNPATAAATPLNSIVLAVESLRLHAVANPGTGTVAAANGQAAITASIDACRIRLKAGVHLGTGAQVTAGSGVQSLATWLVIEGDPAVANPTATIILRSPTTTNTNTRLTRVRLSSLSVEAGTLTPMTATNYWADAGTEFRGLTGVATGVTPPITATGVNFFSAMRYWKHGIGPKLLGSGQRPVYARNIEVEREIAAPLVVNSRRLPSAVVGSAGADGVGTVTQPSTDVGLCVDRIILGNDFRYVSGSLVLGYTFLANASAPGVGTPGNAMGTTYTVASRQAFVNNVCESYGTSFPMMTPVGENAPVVAVENIVEGNTLTGDRANIFYNDLNLATVALNDSENSIALLNRFANNVSTRTPTKHDFYNDSVVQTQRQGTGAYSLATSRNKAKLVGNELTANSNIYRCIVAGTTAATGGPSGTAPDITDGTVHWAWFAPADLRQHGYRSQAVGSWPALYGVDMAGNLDLQPPAQSVPDFWFEFFGLGSLQCSADGVSLTSSPFTLDKSGTDVGAATQMPWLVYDPANTGGGNYVPLTTGSGVYLTGRGVSANSDRDQAGIRRPMPFVAGALQTTTVSLAPAGTRQATSGRSTTTGWSSILALASARLITRTDAAITRWSANLVPVAAQMATRVQASIADWSTTLLPQTASSMSRAGVIVVSIVTPIALAPASTRHAVTDVTRPIVLPATPTLPERTLTVSGDFHLLVVRGD